MRIWLSYASQVCRECRESACGADPGADLELAEPDRDLVQLASAEPARLEPPPSIAIALLIRHGSVWPAALEASRLPTAALPSPHVPGREVEPHTARIAGDDLRGLDWLPGRGYRYDRLSFASRARRGFESRVAPLTFLPMAGRPRSRRGSPAAVPPAAVRVGSSTSSPSRIALVIRLSSSMRSREREKRGNSPDMLDERIT